MYKDINAKKCDTDTAASALMSPYLTKVLIESDCDFESRLFAFNTILRQEEIFENFYNYPTAQRLFYDALNSQPCAYAISIAKKISNKPPYSNVEIEALKASHCAKYLQDPA